VCHEQRIDPWSLETMNEEFESSAWTAGNPTTCLKQSWKRFRGLKVLSQHRRLRMRALGDKLATSDYDLLCLQEVWVQEDFLYIQAKVRHFLPYSHYYFSAFLGSGLAIFSRWPILSTSFFPFQLNGRPAAVWRGDWYAGKGVGTALIRHHTGALIEVFNTHVYPFRDVVWLVSCRVRKRWGYLYVSSNLSSVGDCEVTERRSRAWQICHWRKVFWEGLNWR
jgi:Endonuclease/Exonuclease/phosphatase family